MTSIRDLLRDLRDRFAAAGIEHPEADAELIVGHVLGESRGRVQARAIMGDALSTEDLSSITALAEQRAGRVPLQHLTGTAPFRSLELSVGPGVFVPRPETEIVAQLGLDALRAVPDPEPLALDLCTGSGALALALATEMPTARVWAVERDPAAHAWAQRNVARLGGGRVELILGDVRELDPRGRGGSRAPASSGTRARVREILDLRGRLHLLVSNPPYVPDGMVPRDPEVRDHDPPEALYGGADGLDLIRVISRVGRELLATGGTIVLEHAEGQGAAIRELLAADGWRAPATHPDLTLRDRATTAIR